MWGLVFVAFWHRVRETPSLAKPFGWKSVPVVLANSFHRLFHQPVYAFFVLLLVAPALSGLWSADQAYWLERTRVRLPFLVLPWAFANLPDLSRRQYALVLYIVVWWMALLCIGVGINFALHKTEIMHAMYQGRPMPVPRHHIRFSLMVATAVLAGAWLWQQRFVWRYAWERVALGGVTVFLFGFMHFLSVRSGLFALYAALVFAAARYVVQTRRWGPALALLVLLAATPWIAVQTLPSLKQKFEYTLYDWGQYRQGEGETYSDAERWISLKTGWLIWRDHPWLGVGAGDLPRETTRVLAEHFPHYLPTPKLPHNQFLYILAGTGLLGLALSLLAFLYPLTHTRAARQYLFSAFQVMIFASFLVEYTIETAMGVAWYLFYTLWFLRVRGFRG